jgi:hypothetical protein
MLVGVKFCGGCNPRYERGKAYESIKQLLQGEAEFVIAEEGTEYDQLLVIGGCTNCCASFSQYSTKNGVIKIWDENHIDETINKIRKQEE